MSVNASQPELNQLIYRHLKEHGFLSAAEEFQRHNPQGETKSSVSLLDIYKSWLKDPKKKGLPNSAQSSKSGQGKTSSKAKSVSPRNKTDKPTKNPASPKKSVLAKRKKSDEKQSQSAAKAKKSKLDTTETAGADGSDSDSSLDVEKWKKLLDQLTEADVAKMETINALSSSEPQAKKKRVRKPRAKPLSKADAPVLQNGGTIGQNEKGEETVLTQTPTKTNTAKKSRKENAALVSSSSTLSPNKRAKSLEDRLASSTIPEKKTQLQEMFVSVNVRDEKKDETAPEPKKKKKKKKEKEEIEDKMEGNAKEINGDGKRKDKKQKKRSEITEQEDADKTEGTKRATEDETIEERNSNNANISALDLQKNKGKKKEKEKARSEEDLAQIDEKKKKKVVVIEENSEQLPEEIKPNAHKVGSDKKSKKNVHDKKFKKKKKKNYEEGNLEHVTVGQEEHAEQNIEEKEHLEQMDKKKKAKEKKEKTCSEEYSAQIHEKKKKRVFSNVGNSEQVDEDIKANTELIVTDKNEVQGDKKCEQNDQAKKAKKKKDKSHMEGNSEHVTVAEEENTKQNVKEKEYSEKMGEKKKSKKKKESLGIEETPEEVVREKKAKKKSNKEDVDQAVEEKPKDEGDHSNDKSILETSEQSLETTTPPKKKKKKKNKLKSDEVPEEAEMSTQDVSATQINSADVHKKKKKSKITES